MSGGFEPRGPIAGEIAGLWWLMFWLGLAVFVVFCIVLGVAMARRRGSDTRPDAGARPDADEDHEESARYTRRWIVGLGVVMTTLVLVVVLAFTIASMRAIPNAVAGDALRLDLVAHQWYWDVRYPGGAQTKNVVRIPAGRPVELHLTSADVIHSFWVPALAGKLDALPERTTVLVIEADEPGSYRGQCAEFCGLYHARMIITVVAMPPGEFTAWLERAG